MHQARERGESFAHREPEYHLTPARSTQASLGCPGVVSKPHANSPSSLGERKTSNLWCPSAIPAWGCPCRRTRSSMRSLPRSFMGPVWDCPSAAPSLNRIAAACGLPTTLPAAQVFTSFYPPKSRHMNDAPSRVCGMGASQFIAISSLFGRCKTRCHTLEPFKCCRLEVFDNLRSDLVGRQQHVGSVQRAPSVAPSE